VDNDGPDEEVWLAPVPPGLVGVPGGIAGGRWDGCCGGLAADCVVPGTVGSIALFPSVLVILRLSSYHYEFQSHRPEIRIEQQLENHIPWTPLKHQATRNTQSMLTKRPIALIRRACLPSDLLLYPALSGSDL
jgi:hypothetical protein